ncbi:MAG TPA: type II toxin-antitoxin system RelE/ParE family toxin [Longimicrobiaceae bacterium]|nr:type II toxin-antitoxin system RelE/ParE family toxin [Longimicrobiaceae bacterium]
MAHRVVWSPAALEDAEAIASDIARDSTRYAATVARRLRDTARSLRDFPLSGRIVPEEESIREKLVYSYRLIYRVQGEIVTIAAIVHGKQSFETGVGRIRSI